MPSRPRWSRTLQESRRQACQAVDFYNRSGDKRSYLDFVVHMHLAWQYILHALFERDRVDFLYRDSKGKVLRTSDGDKKSWDLQRCLEYAFPNNDPVRKNVEFFVGLRNKIEHRYQDALIIATRARAHALVINYETAIVAWFGERESLSGELRFPLFVQSLTPAGVEEQRQLRRKLPAAARTYITRFDASLEQITRDSERYEFRILMTPLKGPASQADLAVTFVRAADLSPEERAQIDAAGRAGRVVVAEKERDVFYKDEMLPGQVIAAVNERVPYGFTMANFVSLWKRWGVRPETGAKVKSKTDSRYCVYSAPHQNYVYRPAFVERIIREVGTADKFDAVFGKLPQPKIKGR
jgi:hypothetical protein